MKIKINIKSKKLLKIIFYCFLLIFFRVCHLMFLQKETRANDIKKNQIKTVILHPTRGLIKDRFNNILATNKIKYNACIYYSNIRQIPSIQYIFNETGKKIKTFPRKNHIEALSQFLAKKLNLNALEIENLINSKASLVPYSPFIIKENINEKEYYQLRYEEKNWLGLHTEISTERFYPFNTVASTILGYMGSINQKEYLNTINEISFLEDLKMKLSTNEIINLPNDFDSIDDVLKKLNSLKNKSYRINDFIGKSGIEKSFEKTLRGEAGKKEFIITPNGSFFKQLKDPLLPIKGTDLKLSISYELQAFTEELLDNEEDNDCIINNKKPFIKGGAIVVMDACSNEVLALSSSPRFNPNDFIPSSNQILYKKKQIKINKWLETSSHIAKIYDGIKTLKKDISNNKQLKIDLTWDAFIKLLTSEKNPYVKNVLDKIKNVNNAILIQEKVEELKFLFDEKEAFIIFSFLFPNTQQKTCIIPEKILTNYQNNKSKILQISNYLASFFHTLKTNEDKLFIIDLCKIAVFSPSFSNDLIAKTKTLSLNSYWDLSKKIIKLESILKENEAHLFQENEFEEWKKYELKSFLQKHREKEKNEKKPFKPYVDILKAKQIALFEEYWTYNRINILCANIQKNNFFGSDLLKNFSNNILIEFINTIRKFNQLNRPLLYNYTKVKQNQKDLIEKDLAKCFYPKEYFGYTSSHAINNPSSLGSIFKLITAYTALKQKLRQTINKDLNPMWLTDKIFLDHKRNTILGISDKNKRYPKIYKKGRLPRSLNPNIGRINLMSAIEQSSNLYFSILAGDYIKDPEFLLQDTKSFGFGKRTNIELPWEATGNLPKDISTNKTALYAFAIGQHTLLITPIQVSNMMRTMINGGFLSNPTILKQSTKDDLEIQSTIYMPEEIKNYLIQSMKKVLIGEKGQGRMERIKKLRKNKKIKKTHKALINQLIGKTSTSEILYNLDFTPSAPADQYKHIWFSGISFSDTHYKKPELIITIYLRFADGGKEAIPLATQIMQKYRELKKKYEKNNY